MRLWNRLCVVKKLSSLVWSLSQQNATTALLENFFLLFILIDNYVSFFPMLFFVDTDRLMSIKKGPWKSYRTSWLTAASTEASSKHIASQWLEKYSQAEGSLSTRLVPLLFPMLLPLAAAVSRTLLERPLLSSRLVVLMLKLLCCALIFLLFSADS